MRKLLLLPALALFVGILGSCGKANNNEAKLQNPVSDEKEATAEKTPEPAEAKAKTIADLQEAFKGETTASAKYEAYSKKAEEEGFHAVALLFKAASMAENVHANNHKAVLKEYEAQIPVVTPEFTVNSTRENLQDAINGETYEVTTMYAGFLKDASASKSQLALISMNYAIEVEKKHMVMYKNALAAVDNNSVGDLPQKYYVCPTCGNTYDTTPSERCGISMTSSEKFFEISSL